LVRLYWNPLERDEIYAAWRSHLLRALFGALFAAFFSSVVTRHDAKAWVTPSLSGFRYVNQLNNLHFPFFVTPAWGYQLDRRRQHRFQLLHRVPFRLAIKASTLPHNATIVGVIRPKDTNLPAKAFRAGTQ